MGWEEKEKEEGGAETEEKETGSPACGERRGSQPTFPCA